MAITEGPKELQYGERSQLQAAGQKELPLSGAQRPERAAGRPANPNQPYVPEVAAPAGPQPLSPQMEQYKALMEDYFVAEGAYRTATVAAQPSAGPWGQLLLQAATVARDRTAYLLKTGTPDYDLG